MHCKPCGCQTTAGIVQQQQLLLHVLPRRAHSLSHRAGTCPGSLESSGKQTRAHPCTAEAVAQEVEGCHRCSKEVV